MMSIGKAGRVRSRRAGTLPSGWACILLVLIAAVPMLSCRRLVGTPRPADTATALPIPTATLSVAPSPTPVSPTAAATRPAASPAAPGIETPVTGPGVGQERLLGSYVRPQDISQYCAQMQQYGVRFTWMQLPWSLVEPQKGEFQWKTADAVLRGALDCGLEVGVHVHARSSWATLPTPPYRGRTAPSTPPIDLDNYYAFLFAVASRYRGQVVRYSIEEEAHAEGVYFAGTPEQYMQMLATADRAIHDADPDAIVQDSGLSSAAIGALYAHDLMEAGKTAEAGQFLQTWYANYAPTRAKGESLSFDSEADLRVLFDDDQVQRLLVWTDLLWSRHADDYDVQQIHYFGPWEIMPELLAWLHEQMASRGTDKPIEFWEFGYGWDDVRNYDPQAHARDEAKYMAMAIGEGVLRVLSWQFTDYVASNGHPGLVTAQGPRPAAQSFGVAAAMLNGTTHSARLNLGPGVWGYRYDTPSGVVYAAWSSGPATVRLPIDAATVAVTDVAGQTRAADPAALQVGDSPIFVQAGQ